MFWTSRCKKYFLFTYFHVIYYKRKNFDVYEKEVIVRLSTKTLASLLVVTAVAATVPGISTLPGKKKRRGQFDRILQRHDRKGELRAEVLGIDAAKFRAEQKKLSFEEIARKSGFTSARSFRLALLGKLKEELHRKGWSRGRIEKFVAARRSRVS